MILLLFHIYTHILLLFHFNSQKKVADHAVAEINNRVCVSLRLELGNDFKWWQDADLLPTLRTCPEWC